MGEQPPHFHGHRQRLRGRFVKSGLAGFADHEVVELLLTLAIPRSDVKQPAKALLARFGNLRGILDAPPSELQAVSGIGTVTPVAGNGYILTGKVDLLLGGDGRLELLDFKTSPRPVHSPALLASYERQLCTYAHILETRYGKRPDRLLLYWTAEPRKQDAFMEFPYRPERVAAAGTYFDQA